VALSAIRFVSISSVAVALCGVPTGVAGQPPRVLSAPASFEGDMPCADCPGLVEHVDLFDGGTFLQQLTYKERPPVPPQSGRWLVSTDGAVLMLKGRDAPELLAIRDDGSLKALDADGKPIDSPFPMTLARLPRFAPVGPKPDTRMPPLTNAPLAGARWELSSLGADTAKAEHRPFVIFAANGSAVTGFAGCNRLSGAYVTDGARLSVSRLITTKMACPAAGDLEPRFLSALTRVARYRILDGRLDVYDASGSRLARFDAVR
jgi:heat shock protein HslJ